MTSTLTRPRLAIAALAGIAVAAAPLAAIPAFAAGGDLEDPVTLETGHIDAFNLALNGDGSVRLNLKEDVTGSHVQRTPESVELFVKDDAYLEGLPAAYLPPGAPTTLWYLPMTQDQNLIWPGWDSQGVASVYGAQADVDIVISDVDGPGDVYVWSQGVFGDPAQLLADDWALPDTIHQDYLAHVHANWGFTAPGTYVLTAQATVTSADSTLSSTSNAATYTFVVEPVGGIVDPEPEPTTLAISGVGAHYHTGEIASLTAVQTPASEEDHYHWFTRASSADEWSVVNGAYGDSYGFVVTGEQQVKAVLYDHDHAIIAESEPADIHLDDHGSTPGVGPELDVTLAENEGALVISVSPEGATSTLSELELAPEGDRYVSEGSVTGITVTDTRPGELGWAATGRVRALGTIDGDILDGAYLGWTPTVVSSSAGQSVEAGASVAPGFSSGTGIKGWSALGTAAAGASRGTAVLGADIRIEAPTTTKVGHYSGVLLITVI